MRLTQILTCASLALAAACGDTTSPGATASGSLAFSFTRTDGAGSYAASGAVPLKATTLGSTSWAAGSLETQPAGLMLMGVVPKTATTWDVAILTAVPPSVGTTTIDAEACEDESCPTVLIQFGTSVDQETFQFSCALVSGSIVATKVSATHVTGTFSGTGFCLASGGTISAFSVTNGSFDLPIVVFPEG